jgi:hypothetical protein
MPVYPPLANNIVTPSNGTGTLTIGPGSATLIGPPVTSAEVNGANWTVFENTISALGQADMLINSPLWLNTNQVNYQLFGGIVESMDDTANFSTIFDVNASGDILVFTGCPEPSSFALLGLGLLIYSKWRHLKATV